MALPILYSSWSSSCSSRVRIALALKKIDYEYHAVNIRSEEEQKDFFLNNPAKKVPILKINGLTLTESMAIIEYLDEVYPNPPLLPKDAGEKAHARAIAFHWCNHHITYGFDALEELLKKYSGKFCVGDQITVADINLPSIVYNAKHKYNVDMTPYPTISRIAGVLAEIPEFQAAEASRQPDAPKDN